MNVYYADGVQFMGSCQDKYDLIIVDSTDPIGPGEGLFTREFYQSCFKALAEDGIMVNQHEGAFYDDDVRACQRAHARISEVFPISKVYQANIPTYASGYWLLGLHRRNSTQSRACGKKNGRSWDFYPLLYNQFAQRGLRSSRICRETLGRGEAAIKYKAEDGESSALINTELLPSAYCTIAGGHPSQFTTSKKDFTYSPRRFLYFR